MLKYLALILLLLALTSCAGPTKRGVIYPEERVTRPPEARVPPTQRPYIVLGKKYHPIKSAVGFEEKGLASWYGSDWHGRMTSNGEVYNMYDLTAAHKTLPMETRVRVTNLRNDKETVVRINDRGPFVKDRIIDLSYKAAKEIGLIGPGVTPVKLVALGRPVRAYRDGKLQTILQQPKSYYVGEFTIQVGSFKERTNARRLRDKLSREYDNAHITIYNEGPEIFHRVRISRYDDLLQAMKARDELIRNGFSDAFVVAE